MSERHKPNWLKRTGIAMLGVGAIGFGSSLMNIRINNAQMEVIEKITSTPLSRSSSIKLEEFGVIYEKKLERDMEQDTKVFAVSGLLMLKGSILLYASTMKNRSKQQES